MRGQRLISIYSEMRGGKDTAAAYLMNKLGYPRIKLAYGDALKKHYHEIFGHNGSKKDRDGYQWFGQAMRARQADVWIQNVNGALQYHKDKGHHVFFTDMRQPNEFEHLKANGFTMIRIWTPENIRIERMEAAGETVTLENLRHETEQHIDSFKYDYLVINNGTIEELFEKLDNVLERIERSENNA